jgi:hypothetical protein
MRIAPDRLLGFPGCEFLQRIEWRNVLHVPAGPRVPRVVSTEVLDACEGPGRDDCQPQDRSRPATVCQ